jgi:hypothetical protein
VRLVLVVATADGDMPSANVELYKDGEGVIASATASGLDDPIFQLRAAVDAVEEDYQNRRQISR